MEFTGERFTTDCVREIWYEHWHRYAFALTVVESKVVLDIACGEGYGSHLLAGAAAKVIGMDLSSEAVEHAKSKYQAPNLSFQSGDATATGLESDSIDIIVCFETLEHLSEQEQMLIEFRRVLRPDGVLIVSTPDKRVYSDLTGFDNEFHIRELYREEFESLLGRQFPSYRLYGQKLLFQSVIWAERPGSKAAVATANQAGELDQSLNYEPVYWIAIAAASDNLLPAVSDMHWFGDESESVYQHYNHEIRKNIEAGTLLAKREAQIATLSAAAETQPWWRRWFGKREPK